VGLLLYLSVSGAIDWSSIFGLAMAWPTTVEAFLLLLVTVLLQAQRFRLLLKPQGMLLSFYSSVKLFFMGVFFNSCLPGANGGDAVKIYYAMEGNRGRRTEIAILVLFDRAIGMFALLVLPLLFLPLFPELYGSIRPLRILLWTAAGVSAAMVTTLLLWFMSPVRNSHLFSVVAERLPMGDYAKRIFDAIYTYRHNAGTVLRVVGISLLVHMMNFGVVLLLAGAINPGNPVWKMAVIVPLGFVANSLPITPGGLGVGESAFNKLFTMVGLTGGAAILIGWRLLMLLIGLIGLIFYLQGQKRFVHAAGL
jgi:uncharacterized protein (TIRG00374 family)